MRIDSKTLAYPPRYGAHEENIRGSKDTCGREQYRKVVWQEASSEVANGGRGATRGKTTKVPLYVGCYDYINTLQLVYLHKV